MNERPPLHGLLAEFDSPTHLLTAVHAARQEGYVKMDAFSPFPIEGLAEALGFRRTRLPLVILIGGLVGGVGGFFMEWYASVVDYPQNIGGRPFNSWPAFIPVVFELTVLLGALAAVLGMLGLNGLPMPYHPLFHVPRFALASNDRFFLCIEATDPRFELAATRRFLEGLGPQHIDEVPH
jgi:hypothetical protein